MIAILTEDSVFDILGWFSTHQPGLVVKCPKSIALVATQGMRLRNGRDKEPSTGKDGMMHDPEEEDKSMNKFNSTLWPSLSSRQPRLPLFDAPRHRRQALLMFLDLFSNPIPSFETKNVSIIRTKSILEVGG